MAKLPPETTETIDRLKDRSLGIVDAATATEFTMFEIFGETDRTVPFFDRKEGVSSLPFQGEAAKNSSELQASPFEGGANPKSKIQNPKSADDLKTVAEDAKSSFTRLSNLQLGIAETQPIAAADMLELLAQTMARTTNRIPAWERSIEEVRLEWNLS